jgi:hypothetical protein
MTLAQQRQFCPAKLRDLHAILRPTQHRREGDEKNFVQFMPSILIARIAKVRKYRP